MLFTLIIFIAILALLVLAHEFGHFAAARKNGVGVEEFGFGFPPRLFGVQRLTGQTLKKISETENIEMQVEIQPETGVIEKRIIDKIKETDILAPFKKWRLVWGRGQHLGRADEGWLKAGTVYSLNLIPLGGFVKIKGENGEAVNEPDSFGAKPVWRRGIILSAGVVMNFILGGILLSIGLMMGLPQSLDMIGRGARISEPKVEIMAVLPGSPAARAGIQPGDEIAQLDDWLVHGDKSSEAIAPQLIAVQTYVNAKKGQPIKFSFRRNSEILEKEITPVELATTKKGGIGVALLESGTVSYPWYWAIYRGFEGVIIYSWEILKALWSLLAGLFQGKSVAGELSGPVGIAVLTGRVARLGLAHLLQFTAVISINLAILNFLPIPALDGGRVFFLIMEKLRGRPLRQKVEQWTHAVGFAALMLLVVFVTYRDVARFSENFVRLGKKIIGM